MKLFSLLAVLSLGLFGCQPYTTEVTVQDTAPNPSVIPLAFFALFQTLEEAVAAVTPTRRPGRQRRGPREPHQRDPRSIGQDVNTALNKLVPKLGLDGLLTPVDTAVYGLLVSLDASLVPSLLAALQLLLVGLGGVVGGLLAGLNLASL
ncbi:hypothetical protein DFH08DRAFT_801309 [Mycena albidolilacea]|uniref:Uncharacterized protein n=1 Tax=Mycena albidolilacea TaxID=1033008 RepID=A0AAD7EYN8_9AGAR|nr:hypothetical protein DFH08DRAFT_801309 [Mycena albidolilacea]